MSVKPVHLNTVMSVDTAKEAWDALTVMFEARDNAQLVRLMDELSSLKKGGDENIIKFTSRANMIRDELAMPGNPVDNNTLALRGLSGLPAEYGMLRTVLENKDTKLVLSDVTAKLFQVEQRSISVCSSKPSGGVKSQEFRQRRLRSLLTRSQSWASTATRRRTYSSTATRRRRMRPRARASPAVVVVTAAKEVGPRRLPLWPTRLQPFRP